jgi:hypothetical protein
MLQSKYNNNPYTSLGDYIPKTSIPIVSAVNYGSMTIPVFAGYTSNDYSNPNYDTLMGVNGNNYDSVSNAYMKHCKDGNCVTYTKVANACNTIPMSVNASRNSRI